MMYRYGGICLGIRVDGREFYVCKYVEGSSYNVSSSEEISRKFD